MMYFGPRGLFFTLINSVDFDEIWVFTVFMGFQYTHS